MNNAHIMTDVLSSFALSGDSASAGQAGKSLQLAAFAQEGAHRGPDLTVRVYVLPDNAAALAQVTESERRYNGRLLDKPMSFLFKVRQLIALNRHTFTDWETLHARIRAAKAGKAPKAWALPRFWVSIRSYTTGKKIWGRI